MSVTITTEDTTAFTVGGVDFSHEAAFVSEELVGGYRIETLITDDRLAVAKEWEDGRPLHVIHKQVKVSRQPGATVTTTREDEATVTLIRAWQYPDQGTMCLLFKLAQ